MYSESLGFSSWQATLADYGLSLPSQRYPSFIGKDALASANEILRLFKLPISPQTLIQARIQKLLPMLDSNLEPAPGVIPLLTTLQDHNFQLAVASNSYSVYVHKVLTCLGLESFFDCVLCGEDVPAGKPAPDIFLAASSCLQEKPSHCAVIEDSMSGVEAAISAGMTCIAVPNPMLPEADFSLANAKFESLIVFHNALGGVLSN